MVCSCFLFALCLLVQAQSDSLGRDYWITRYKSVSFPLNKVRISSTFGGRKDPFTKKSSMHTGLDLKANYEKVMTMFDGVVEKIGSDQRSGNYVIVRSGDYCLSYCHLSKRLCSEGDTVLAGWPIAISGNTGRSTNPHLHLTARLRGKVVDPHRLLLYVKQVRNECIAALGGSKKGYENVSCADFLSQYAAMAMNHQRRYGIPASVTLAQMALESSWGTSDLAQDGNNYFGIKCSRKWLADGKPYSQHDDEKKNEKFCNYSTVAESMEHHSRILVSDRYKKYCSYSPTDYHRWLRGLKKAGYASSKSYVANCESIIKKYKLYLYDQEAAKTM